MPTKHQQRILDAIHFFLRKGEVPTVREVGALVGLRSPATVLKHLRALQKEKLISLTGKSRGIRLYEPITLGRSFEPSSSEPFYSASSFGPSSFGRGSPAPSSLGHRRPSAPLSESTSSQQDAGAPESRGADAGGASITPIPIHLPNRRIPLVGAIAAGKPFESYSDAFFSGACLNVDSPEWGALEAPDDLPELPIDPGMFVTSGEVFALRVQGDSMINAGILDGDYVIIRRQDHVEEGEIAAVLINGEGTLKRWRTRSSHGTTSPDGNISLEGKRRVSLQPANERFEPIEITEEDSKEVLVFGKYVGLVRGAL